MESVIERITRGSFWQFHGGIHPPEQKFLTNSKPIGHAQLPDKLIIPLRQHIGQAGTLIVSIGDHVLKGQPLTQPDTPMAVPVHAPTSGTIFAINESVIPHPSGLSEPCLFLKPDGEDTWCERSICPDYKALSNIQIIEKITRAGIAGMGGAGFPTQVKVATKAKIDYLIINAAECEPYITADDLLIQEHSPTILDGIKILDHLLSPKNILIGIEDNKPSAIEVLRKVTKDIANIQVCVIPTKYPSGGEKQLIKILTGHEVPSGVLPSSLGIVMQNIATCYAIADAVINDSPLIKRVVSVTGQALKKPQNLWALIGTPVGQLISACSYNNTSYKHLIMGGPMMGFSLPNDQVPIIKTTNCILAPSEIEIASPYSSTSSKEVECIRCGQCADVCPAQLLPQELQWSAKAKDQKQLTTLNLFDCIECGACAYVCPSQIPLVHYYRVAKAEIRQQKLLDLKAEKAKVRFEARKLRLERDKIARAEKHKKAAEARKARMSANTSEAKVEKSAVAAALARVKAKKAQADKSTIDASSTTENTSNDIPSEKSQVANAIARAKAKKLAQKAQQETSGASTEQTATLVSEQPNANDKTTGLDKKSKVAAAIAKAKAKKLAQQASGNTELQAESAVINSPVSNNEKAKTNESSTAIDKKAKVAAAVAKAKAKKLAQNAKTSNSPKIDADDESSINEQSPLPKTDSTQTTEPSAPMDKKAKVAAAVAKAKAKKLAQNAKTSNGPKVDADDESSINEQGPLPKTESTQTTEPSVAIDKKAKIAAAIAKAKAKKIAKKNEFETPISDPASLQKANSNEDVLNEKDEKKARIAAAIAKAKAKKVASQANKSQTSE